MSKKKTAKPKQKIFDLCEKVLHVLDMNVKDPGPSFDRLFIELLRYDFNTHDPKKPDLWVLGIMYKIEKVYKQER